MAIVINTPDPTVDTPIPVGPGMTYLLTGVGGPTLTDDYADLTLYYTHPGSGNLQILGYGRTDLGGATFALVKISQGANLNGAAVGVTLRVIAAAHHHAGTTFESHDYNAGQFTWDPLSGLANLIGGGTDEVLASVRKLFVNAP